MQDNDKADQEMKYRRNLGLNSKLSGDEIDRLCRYDFNGMATIAEQVDRYSLMVKRDHECRFPSISADFANVSMDDHFAIAGILEKYVAGFVLYTDKGCITKKGVQSKKYE